MYVRLLRKSLLIEAFGLKDCILDTISGYHVIISLLCSVRQRGSNLKKTVKRKHLFLFCPLRSIITLKASNLRKCFSDTTFLVRINIYLVSVLLPLAAMLIRKSLHCRCSFMVVLYRSMGIGE